MLSMRMMVQSVYVWKYCQVLFKEKCLLVSPQSMILTHELLMVMTATFIFSSC